MDVEIIIVSICIIYITITDEIYGLDKPKLITLVSMGFMFKILHYWLLTFLMQHVHIFMFIYFAAAIFSLCKNLLCPRKKVK